MNRRSHRGHRRAVHHIDGDPNNNDIENLVLVEVSSPARCPHTTTVWDDVPRCLLPAGHDGEHEYPPLLWRMPS